MCIEELGMKSIVTLTLNPAVDKSSSVNSVASEIKLRCSAPRFDPGGGGINVSRAIHKLGGDSLAIYAGGGSTAHMLHSLLEEEGVRQQIVPITGRTRENFIVYEETSGLQYRFGMPGPVMSPAEWQRCIDIICETEADYVVASGSLPAGVPSSFYVDLAQQLQNTKARLIVDTAEDALAAIKGAGVYLVKPNIGELETLSGERFLGEEHLRQVCQLLVKQGLAEVLVVSLGAGGAAFVTADDYAQLRPPVVPIQSKVGAGDSMVGGITLALARGWELKEAVRYGIAAGTAAVMTPGTELCRLEDTERIYRRVVEVHGL